MLSNLLKRYGSNYNQKGGATAPEQLMVKYEFNEITPGKKMGQLEVANQPLVYWDSQIGQGPYTLLMVDPDAPDPKAPIYREWIHWMIVNVPGNRINQAQEVLPYQAPTPPRGTHRYNFYLYDQLGKMLPPNLTYNRQSFQRPVFLWQYGLLRNPLATNYYTVDTLNPEGVNLNL